MSLGSNHITPTTAANFIPELWALDVLEAAESNLVMANLVTRFDDVASEGGDVINVPKISNFSAQNKAPNAQVTPQSATEEKVSITLSNHKEVSFLIEDIVAVQAKSSLREIYTKKAGYAIAKAIDTHLLGLYAGLSQSSSAGEIGETTLLDAMTNLDNADAPPEGRFLVICPEAKADILKLGKFTSRDYASPNDPNAPMQTGLLGDIFGCKVFMSNNVAATTDSGVDQHHNLMFQRGAFALAIQLGPRVQANYVPEYLGTLVTVDVIYGYSILNEKLASEIISY
jgi:N4-gp56 family major capsid protein